MQKAAQAQILRSQVSTSSKRFEKMTAANKKTFFAHCLGRMALMAAIITFGLVDPIVLAPLGR